MVSPKRKHKGRFTLEGRARIVFLYQDGATPKEIAQKLNADVRCIQRILDTYLQSNSILPSPRKPKKKTRRLTLYSKKVRMIARKNPTINARQILIKLGVETSRAEFQKILKEDGGAKYLAARKGVCLNEEKRMTRVTFCRQMKNYDISKLIWGDEKWFCVSTGPTRTWVFPNQQRYHKIVHQHPIKVLVWGGISWFGRVPLYFFDGTVNSVEYCKVMDHIKRWVRGLREPKLSEVVVQQDNARPHVSRASLAHAQSIGLNILEDWPPSSPDLNCVENMWGIMVPYVNAKNPRTTAELKAAVGSAWTEVPQNIVDNLVRSPYRRFEECLERNGGQIDV